MVTLFQEHFGVCYFSWRTDVAVYIFIWSSYCET